MYFCFVSRQVNPFTFWAEQEKEMLLRSFCEELRLSEFLKYKFSSGYVTLELVYKNWYK